MLTTRVETVDGVITGYVDQDGTPWIVQPFDPVTGEAWSSRKVAQAWCEEYVSTYEDRVAAILAAQQLNDPAAGVTSDGADTQP